MQDKNKTAEEAPERKIFRKHLSAARIKKNIGTPEEIDEILDDPDMSFVYDMLNEFAADKDKIIEKLMDSIRELASKAWESRKEQDIRIEELKAKNEKLEDVLKFIKSLDVNTNTNSYEDDWVIIIDRVDEALELKGGNDGE